MNCFVIMGFGIKDGLDLDISYNKIIKPCIKKNKLTPFPLYQNMKFNGYRCDEIKGNMSIDSKFIRCLRGADIVIADISTMNQNAIYELGARHTMKQFSTILLCAESYSVPYKFFDLTYVPVIFYKHNGTTIAASEIKKARHALNEQIQFCLEEKHKGPDNPIQRAFLELELENNQEFECLTPDRSIYELYLSAKQCLSKCEYEKSIEYFTELYHLDCSSENYLMLMLAKYKLADSEKNVEQLQDCFCTLDKYVETNSLKSETAFGRLAAIAIRIFNLTHENTFLYKAIDNYLKGIPYSTRTLYCQRNYCASMLRIHEITQDPNVLREYYYTAIYFAKKYSSLLELPLANNLSKEDAIYLRCNSNDLIAIANSNASYLDNILQQVSQNKSNISDLQKDTIIQGVSRLKEDIIIMKKLIKSFGSEKTTV